ncbi:MAG: hypothetical protein ACI8QS_000473 [Planctomycetota bacterium]|jgi:hypothetical protein
MRRGHRKTHFVVWAILAPLALLGLFFGIAARREMPTQAPPVMDELPQSNPPATEVIDK